MKNINVDFQNEVTEVSGGILKSNTNGNLELPTNHHGL